VRSVFPGFLSTAERYTTLAQAESFRPWKTTMEKPTPETVVGRGGHTRVCFDGEERPNDG
jgi:hypothetical protein